MVWSPDESEVALLCPGSKLLITDQVGGPEHHLHHLSAAPLCVKDWLGVLHMGDGTRAFAVVPPHVYSARSEQVFYIYPNVSNRYRWCTVLCTLLNLWFRRTGMLQWEGGGDHLPHKMRWANEKQHSLVTHTVGYFTEITGVGTSCGYLEDLGHRQRAAQSEGLGTSCCPTILSSVTWGCSKFGTMQRCMTAGCPVIPGCKPRSGLMIHRIMILFAGSVEGGASRNQWANVWGSVVRTRGECESASSFPLFNAPFIHLQNMGIPTLFQPQAKNRHALHSLLI